MDINIIKWDLRFLELSKLISSWSKDKSTQVGSVIVDPKRRIVSTGYNGFPMGMSDDIRLDIRSEKYKIIIHAERNAILFAGKSLENCTIYTYPFMPCSVCAGMIIQSQIKRVVTFKTNNVRWAEDFEFARSMFKETNIETVEYNNEDLEKIL